MTPDAYTIREHFIDVGDGHELYVHDWGNKHAKHVVFNVHGGPGGGTRDSKKSLYDPETQRVIFFDQRGSGRSIPLGSLDHNTTEDLVDDITKIADTLHIDTFILRGGSWGSTLSLAYAIKHPERVEALVIDGIFTASHEEEAWLYEGRFRTFFPDVWQQVLDATPKTHHDDPIAYHVSRALCDDAEAAKRSLYVIGNMESAVIRLDDRFTPSDYETFDPSQARIETYYLHNHCFMPDGYILKHAHTITAPVYIIQGRYDNVCPPITAHRLHQVLPNSELLWTISGHAGEHEVWNLTRTILKTLTK